MAEVMRVAIMGPTIIIHVYKPYIITGVNQFRPRQIGRHCADGIFKSISLYIYC